MTATIAVMPSQIELYEEMSALSSRMVAAARGGDWDTLIDLEQGVARLRDTLLVTHDNLSSTDAERKRLLIQRILDDDAEIRTHTEPWMEQVRRFLGTANRRDRVAKAYGAG